MINKITLLLLLVTIGYACKTPQALTQADAEAILEVLAEQEDNWNAGDIDAFMKGYWNSEDLCFMGSNGLNKSWETTRARYHKSYPNKEKMGILTFDIINMKPLGYSNYLIHGKYSLQRKEDNPSGYFTLVFEKIDGEWLIISDHTS